MKHLHNITRNYAQRRIAFIAFLLILLTGVLLTLITSIYYGRFTSDSRTEAARRFESAFSDTLQLISLDQLDEEQDEVIFSTIHDYTRRLCSIVGGKYAYIFIASKDSDKIKYVLTAAVDDEDDATFSANRELGEEFNIGERRFIDQALDGKFSDPEHVENEFGDVLSYYFPANLNDCKGFDVVVGIDFDITRMHSDANSYVLRIVLIVTSVLTAVMLLMLFILRRRVFIPIKLIALKMNSFDPETEQEKLELRTYHEIEEINGSFNKLTEEIIGYIRNLRTMSNERAKTAAEFGIARNIQIGMVPEKLAFTGKAYDVFASAVPARDVGGDFYDFFEIKGRAYIVVGDVSGKGIAAALFMAMVKNMIKEKLRSGASPADALNYANDELCQENPEGMFVTVFAAMLDTRTGELVYANAGHTRPLILSNNTKVFLDPDPGIALGLFEDAGIVNEFRLLRDGASLTVYTDGITEAVSTDNKLFGEDKLLRSAAAGPAEQTAMSVRNAVAGFTEGCEQADDITIVTLRFNENGKFVRMDFPPEMSHLDEFRNTLLSLSGSSENRKRIALACEELLVNIIDYSDTAKIRLIINLIGDELTVRFEDGGKPFDPFAELPPQKGFEEYDQGGLGIRMVTEIAKDIRYLFVQGKNITTITFAL